MAQKMTTKYIVLINAPKFSHQMHFDVKSIALRKVASNYFHLNLKKIENSNKDKDSLEALLKCLKDPRAFQIRKAAASASRNIEENKNQIIVLNAIIEAFKVRNFFHFHIIKDEVVEEVKLEQIATIAKLGSRINQEKKPNSSDSDSSQELDSQEGKEKEEATNQQEHNQSDETISILTQLMREGNDGIYHQNKKLN